LVRRFNKLADLTTPEYYLRVGVFYPSKDPNTDEETKKSRQQRDENDREMFERYLGKLDKEKPVDLQKELTGNPRYKEDLARIETLLHQAAKRLQVIRDKVDRSFRVLDVKFSTPLRSTE